MLYHDSCYVRALLDRVAVVSEAAKIKKKQTLNNTIF